VVKAATGSNEGGGGSSGVWIQLAFGVVLLLMAAMNLRKYNDTDAPKIFDTIQNMGPGAVFVLALGVTLFNPKNLALLLSAGETMREASLETGQIVLVSALFTLLAMSPFLAVVGYQLLGGQTAERRLIAMKEALLRNNHKIMFWVTGVLGLLFLGRAVPSLIG
jgi:threonine/homoserine/homoserine lactone efflux protein